MRLIDADVLLNSIPNAKYPDKKVGLNDAIADFIELICDCPTAYDMNNIIQHLEEYKKGADNAISDDELKREGIKTGLDWAIEEIKKGGAE